MIIITVYIVNTAYSDRRRHFIVRQTNHLSLILVNHCFRGDDGCTIPPPCGRHSSTVLCIGLNTPSVLVHQICFAMSFLALSSHLTRGVALIFLLHILLLLILLLLFLILPSIMANLCHPSRAVSINSFHLHDSYINLSRLSVTVKTMH